MRRLRIAWAYDTADGPNVSQTQPIVVKGVLYGLTPAHKVVALDAATGNLLWRYDSGIEGRGPNRRLVYWTDGAQQRTFTSAQSFIFALDAQTGKPIKRGPEGTRQIRFAARRSLRPSLVLA